MVCHLRPQSQWGDEYEAATGDSVTLFADHYDSRPQGLPADYWSEDSDSSYQFAAHPKKGGRLTCLRADYGDKEIVRRSNAVSEITFTVESGKKTLSLLFVVGDSPYDFGTLVEDCGDGSTHELCGVGTGYPVATIFIEGKP